VKKINLENVVIDGQSFENLVVFVDRDGIILIIPLLFAAYLEAQGDAFTVKTTEQSGCSVKELIPSPISENTAKAYCNHVGRLLSFIEDMTTDEVPGYPTLHDIYALSEDKLDYYLNTVLPKTLSPNSLNAHCSAIQAFFNFLAHLKVRGMTELKISRKARKRAANQDGRKYYTQYLSKEDRNILLNICTSKRDRLIMRMGFECGLRAAENCGLCYRGKHKKSSLLKLFKDLDDPSKSHVQQFEYLLRDYTKGKKSRMIYIDRSLLLAIRNYHVTERANVFAESGLDSEPDALFLNDDQRYKGQPISANRASQRFSTYREDMPHLDEALSYHDLRHTFATELYHEQLVDSTGNETRSESAALLVVAVRLGHALGRDGQPANVTRKYNRLREVMLAVEGIC
jgi:site-specific recombinase XerD